MPEKDIQRATGRGARSGKSRGSKKATGGTETMEPKRGAAEQRSEAGGGQRSGSPTHDQIARRAEAIWRQHGCPQGEDDRNWREAEAQLRHEMSAG